MNNNDYKKNVSAQYLKESINEHFYVFHETWINQSKTFLTH
jgi:hypothetical protein